MRRRGARGGGAARARRRRLETRARPAAPAAAHARSVAPRRDPRLPAERAGADRRRGDAARGDRGGARRGRADAGLRAAGLGRAPGLAGICSRPATLGGVLACNLSGPRRIKAGAARDHFLGFRGVSGRGEIFKAGGKVVKNVTGYDLCKLMAGSYGTLAALEEVTVKVLPRPEAARTVLLCGLDAAAAVRCLNQALASPHEVSGAAYLPACSTAALTSLTGVPRRRRAAARRAAPSVSFRRDRLLAELGSDCESTSLDDEASAAFWRAIRDVTAARRARRPRGLARLGRAEPRRRARRGDRAQPRREVVSRLGRRPALGGGRREPRMAAPQ